MAHVIRRNALLTLDHNLAACHWHPADPQDQDPSGPYFDADEVHDVAASICFVSYELNHSLPTISPYQWNQSVTPLPIDQKSICYITQPIFFLGLWLFLLSQLNPCQIHKSIGLIQRRFQRISSFKKGIYIDFHYNEFQTYLIQVTSINYSISRFYEFRLLLTF